MKAFLIGKNNDLYVKFGKVIVGAVGSWLVCLPPDKADCLCLSSGQGHYTYMYCVVFLGKAVYSQCRSLSTHVFKFNVGG